MNAGSAPQGGSPHRFQAEIKAGSRGGAYVIVPRDVHAVFGASGRVPVVARFDGEPYRGSIAPMGGRHILGVTRAIRDAIGKSVGDMVDVVLERDNAARTVALPPDLEAALAASPEARAAYERLSTTHRKEYVQWVEQAKRPETRARRVATTVERLSEGPLR